MTNVVDINRKSILREYLATVEGKTREDYKKNLLNFFAWLGGRKLNFLGLEDINSYKDKLINDGLSPNSVNAYLSPIRGFFNFAEPHIQINPAKFLRNVKVKESELKQARCLTDLELTKLFNATSKDTLKDFQDRIMLLLMFNLGLRLQEVLVLKKRDIQLDIEVPQIVINGKGDKQRVLGLNDVLVEEISQYLMCWGNNLDWDDYIVQGSYWKFKTKNTKPSARSYGRRVFLNVCKRAGIDTLGISTHSARTTAINILLNQDVSIRDTANFAGHSNIHTTMRYDRSNLSKVVETCKTINIGGQK